MSGSNEVLSILPSLFFDGVVPFADNVSDLRLIYEWYTTGHWRFATSMLIPFLLNASANIYHWWKWDSKEEKKYTWLLLILQLWPIYRAIKLAMKTWKKLPGVDAERKKFEGEVLSLEPYLESLPSLLVMGMAWTTGNCGGTECESNQMAVVGETPIYFYISFCISVLTSTLGISKYLLKGPVRILSEDGALKGMLTCPFSFLFMVTLVSVVPKSFGIVFMTSRFYETFNILAELPDLVIFSNDSYPRSVPQQMHYYYIHSISLVFVVMVLPHILLSIGCVVSATGFSKQFFKIVFGNPQLCLLPVFTHLGIGNRRLQCTSGPHHDIDQRQLLVSKELTIVNMFLNVVSWAVNYGILTAMEDDNDPFGFTRDVIFVMVLCTPPGIIFTSLFLCLGSSCCCPCCTTGCCKVEYQHMEVIHSVEMGNELQILGANDNQDNGQKKKQGSIQK